MKNVITNKTYDKWLKSDKVWPHDKKILRQMSARTIENNFSTTLAFGTAGIRRHMGLGTALLNTYTLKMVAWAWVTSLEKNCSEVLKKGLVITHDTRNNGVKFSEIVAQVVSGMGYQALLYQDNDPIPTPLVSYMIRKLKLGGGACITASHNPPQFNGFKCFNAHGQHLMDNESVLIANELTKIDINAEIPQNTKNIKYLDAKVATNYLTDIKNIIKIDKNMVKNIKVVFSPQHGASYKLGPRILEETGFKVYQVPNQSVPDGNFTHTPDPNPENHGAFNEMIKLGHAIKADVLLTTDPDGDRMAVGVRYKAGYYLFNGHEMAALIVYYYLNKIKNHIRKDDYLIKTIVTTTLVDDIAKTYGVKVKKTLTGYKYIGNLIVKNKIPPLMTTEESYGSSLCPTMSLDKDAMQLLPIVAEAIQYYKNQGKTLVDVLELDIYNKWGYYIHYNERCKLDGKKAKANVPKLIATMAKLKYLGSLKIKSISDFRKKVANFDVANLVILYFEDDSWIAIRPSGTEPLIRKYFCIKGSTKQAAKAKEKIIKHHFQAIIEKAMTN